MKRSRKEEGTDDDILGILTEINSARKQPDPLMVRAIVEITWQRHRAEGLHKALHQARMRNKHKPSEQTQAA